MQMRCAALVAMGLLALASCGQSNGDQSATGLFPEVKTRRDAGWSFEQSNDAITDAHVSKSMKSVWDENQTFHAQFVFTCTVDKQRMDLQLDVSLFDKADTGVAVRQQNTIWGFSAFQYALRLDQDDPITSGAFMRNFSNQIILLNFNSESPSASASIRHAKKLALAVPLESGDPTFVTSLEDDNIEQVLEGCGAVFAETKADVTDAKETGERVEVISPEELGEWLREVSPSGSGLLTAAIATLKSRGILEEPLDLHDYIVETKVRKRATFLGSEVLFIQYGEDGTNSLGCCRIPGFKFYLGSGSAHGAIEKFASQNGCRLDAFDNRLRDIYKSNLSEMDAQVPATSFAEKVVQILDCTYTGGR